MYESSILIRLVDGIFRQFRTFHFIYFSLARWRIEEKKKNLPALVAIKLRLKNEIKQKTVEIAQV